MNEVNALYCNEEVNQGRGPGAKGLTMVHNTQIHPNYECALSSQKWLSCVIKSGILKWGYTVECPYNPMTFRNERRGPC